MMSITITDPALLAQLEGAERPVDLLAPDGRVIGVLTRTQAEEILAAADKLAENPLFDEWVKAVEEYRRVHNTVPNDE
jgi:hypothetical protein